MGYDLTPLRGYLMTPTMHNHLVTMKSRPEPDGDFNVDESVSDPEDPDAKLNMFVTGWEEQMCQ